MWVLAQCKVLLSTVEPSPLVPLCLLNCLVPRRNRMVLCLLDALSFGAPSQRSIEHTQYVKHPGNVGVCVQENFMAATNAIFFLQEFQLDLAEHRQE